MVEHSCCTREGTPDPARYEQHDRDSSSKVPGATIRHGKVFGRRFRRARVRALLRVRVPGHGRVQGRHAVEEFAAAGKDAMEMGIPFNVYFVEL